jgi:hypothetical protein
MFEKFILVGFFWLHLSLRLLSIGEIDLQSQLFFQKLIG